MSFQVSCKSQEEVEEYHWTKLPTGGGEQAQHAVGLKMNMGFMGKSFLLYQLK